MKEPIKNIPASIQARLRSEAERQGRPFAEILQYYASDDFAKIMEQIWEFLEHALQLSLHKTKSNRNWIPNKGWA